MVGFRMGVRRLGGGLLLATVLAAGAWAEEPAAEGMPALGEIGAEGPYDGGLPDPAAEGIPAPEEADAGEPYDDNLPDPALTEGDDAVPASEAPPVVEALAREPDGEARVPPASPVVHAAGFFRLRAVEIGREGAAPRKVSGGRLIVEAATTHIVHPNLVEELTTDASGARQQFVISAVPSGRGELHLLLQARGATVAARGEGAVLSLRGGGELRYQAPKVTDSDGRSLPARMAAEGADQLRITVDDRGARYPVRVEPAAAEGEWASMAARGH